MMDIHPKILSSIRKLDHWIDGNGWPGWDPYDIKGKRWVIKLASKSNQSLLFKYLRETAYEKFYCFPQSSRRLLHIKPDINPKAMGLFASGYLDLYKLTGEKDFLIKSEYCITWLLENAVYHKGGMGWGYPFDWQSTEFIPRGTPNGIVTTMAGKAILEYFEFTGDEKYLKICTDICQFLLSLPTDTINNKLLCFSYTPLFINHVHNLNLFIAEYLLRIGKLINKPEWEELAIMAVNYTISAQNNDGSFDYNGPPEKPMHFIDHYHTGFVLRNLHSIWGLTHKDYVFTALQRCYNHYMQNFFHDEVIPKVKPDQLYRIDIHSCSESILCLSELSEVFPESLIKAGKVLDWTISNLQDPAGYFYYGYLRSRLTGIVFKSKIPYMRWGQAWMLKAICKYLEMTKQNHPISFNDR